MLIRIANREDPDQTASSEYKSHHPLRRVSSDFLIFLPFSHSFFAHPINLKGLVVIYMFQGLTHIFKDNFTNSRTIPGQKALFFKFQEFSRTWSNSWTFPGLCESCLCSKI